MLFSKEGRPLAYYFLWVLPRNLFSRLCGLVADARLPKFILIPLIRLFSRSFGIDLTEAEKPISEYPTFNAFFTRRLLPDARPFDLDSEAVLCPVDGTIGGFGTISAGRLLQAKGLYCKRVKSTYDF